MRVFDNALNWVLGETPHAAIPVMDGPWLPNSALDESTPLLQWHDFSPDDATLSPDGTLFVSCGHKIFRLQHPYQGEQHVLADLGAPAGALAWHPNGYLLACVSGHGLACIDLDGVVTWALVPLGQNFHSLTSVTVASDGTVFMTEGSDTHSPDQWREDLMGKGRSGRLISLHLTSGQFRVLLDGLAWPAGVVLSSDEKQLFFTQAWKYVVDTCRIDGSQHQPFLRNLVGYPARLKAAARNGFWMTFLAVRTHLVELVLRDDDFRKDMMANMAPDHWIAPSLAASGSYMEPLQGGAIKKLGMTKPWAPPRSYGLVARISEHGDVLQTMHSRSGGAVHGVTSALPCRDGLLIVSRGHRKLLKCTTGGGQ